MSLEQAIAHNRDGWHWNEETLGVLRDVWNEV